MITVRTEGQDFVYIKFIAKIVYISASQLEKKNSTITCFCLKKQQRRVFSKERRDKLWEGFSPFLCRNFSLHLLKAILQYYCLMTAEIASFSMNQTWWSLYVTLQMPGQRWNLTESRVVMLATGSCYMQPKELWLPDSFYDSFSSRPLCYNRCLAWELKYRLS